MQVLLGLQANALKFTKEGSVKIRVEIISKPGDSNRYLQISVADSGIGIDKKDHDKLFKLFGFVSDSQQMNTKGIGLGLVIAKLIVEQFNGQISFESEKDVGSTFTFTFMLDNQNLSVIDSLDA